MHDRNKLCAAFNFVVYGKGIFPNVRYAFMKPVTAPQITGFKVERKLLYQKHAPVYQINVHLSDFIYSQIKILTLSIF